MEKKVYDLKADPSHDLYRGLIDFAPRICPLGLLVVRPGMELTEEGRGFLAALRPYVESEERSNRWPGTELYDAEATLFYFRLEPGSSRLLKAATDHLYGWCHPELPEDLCFLRADREPWLGTIAHEEDGFFNLTEWEMRQLLHALPALRIAPSAQPA
jgi:hypothetical protein